MKYTDITSHEIACQVLGKAFNASATADQQLVDIAKAINKVDNEFKVDYKNTNQEKWFPVFDASRGFAFSASICDRWFSYSDVGSRLCERFSCEEIADFYGKQFNELHIKRFYE